MNTVAELNEALVGRYLVENEIGQGGMATVYLARDVRHDRKVAIKVLKPELAAVLGAERFVQEIRTTAALSHPHILPLFDSGTCHPERSGAPGRDVAGSRSLLYYVMPYIEGETIREKLNRDTQFGVDEAVRIATEVADALDYAHRHGVIHRDIKPENLLLHDGRPMVLDFGIALAVSAAAGGRMTETGLSLGTPHYMSPEQATADKEITNRSDIYSLATVLYEMLTGQPPHLGGSAQQVIMKIVTEEAAPVTTLRKSVPPNVAAAVGKALEKLPADRFDSAAAFAAALHDLSYHSADAALSAALSAAPGRKHRSRSVLAAAALLVATGGYALGRQHIAGPATGGREPVHLRLGLGPQPSSTAPDLAIADGNTIHLGTGTSDDSRPNRTVIALSPDGAQLVLAGRRGGRRMLFLRPLASDSAAPIAGTEAGESPFFSPDGQSIGFWSRGKLRRVALHGGVPTDIGTVDRIIGASWGDNNRIVVGRYEGSDLLIFSASGLGIPDTIREQNAVLPQFLPGSERILFTRLSSQGVVASARLEILTLRTQQSRLLVEDAADGRWTGAGTVVFARRGVLMAIPVSERTFAASGKAVAVIDEVMQSLNGPSAYDRTGAAQVALSSTGTIAYLTGGMMPDDTGRLISIDRRGTVTPLLLPGRWYYAARFSPDGHRLAVTTTGLKGALNIIDLGSHSVQKFPLTATQVWPLWTPDGHDIVHLGSINDTIGLMVSTADGSRPVQPLRGGDTNTAIPALWTPDGTALLAVGRTTHGVFAVDPTTGQTRRIAALPRDAEYPAISPDGRWVAYVAADADSVNDVYVQPWPALDGKWKVSTGGATAPAWTRGGKELLYVMRVSNDSTGRRQYQMISVDATGGATPSFSTPHVLFATTFNNNYPVRVWDVTPDGKRFIAPQVWTPRSPPGDVHVIVNWFTALHRLLAQ